MNNVQRNFFKFLFILGVWSFLLIGLVKINNVNIDLPLDSSAASQLYVRKIPLHRNLLEREKFFGDPTSTTSQPERTYAIVHNDVLIDNRTGKHESLLWGKREIDDQLQKKFSFLFSFC